MKSRLSIIIFLCLYIVNSAFAQQYLSVDEAVKTALENNYQIQILTNENAINEVNYNVALKAVFPVMNATASDVQEFNSINQKYSSGNETKETGVGSNDLAIGIEASLPLFNGFRLYATKNRLQQLLSAGENNLNAEIQNTAALVQVQYYKIVSAQDYIQTLNEAIAVAEKQLEIAKVRKATGIASGTEVYLAQINVNNGRLALQQQELIMQQYIADLNTTMLYAADTMYAVVDTIIINDALQYETFKNAVLSNPAYVAYNYTVNAAQWAEKEARSLRLPNLNLTGGYNYFANRSEAGFFLVNQNYGPYIGVTLNVPIYNAGVYKGAEEVARLNTENLMLQQRSVLNDLQSALFKAWLAYENNIQQLNIAKENKDIAEKNLDLEMQRYQLNESTIIELNEVQQNYTDINFAYTQLLFNIKSAEIELYRLSGMMK